MDADPERPFLEHLDELRVRLRNSLLLAAAGALAAGLSFQRLSGLVRRQLREAFAAVGHPEDFSGALVSLSPTDVVGLLFKFSLAGGVLLALPLLLVQLWGFVSPALRARERSVAFWVVTLGPVLFLGGFLFSFFQLMPVTARCLLTVSYHYGFVPRWTAEAYFGFFLTLNLAFAACFELPLVMLILSAVGLVNPSLYGRYRKHWAVAAFVIGGLLPPPEVVSMVIQAGALILLYEVGILGARLFMPRQKALQEERQGQ